MSNEAQQDENQLELTEQSIATKQANELILKLN